MSMFDKLKAPEPKDPVVENEIDKCTSCGGNIILVRKCRICEKCGKSPFDELNELED